MNHIAPRIAAAVALCVAASACSAEDPAEVDGDRQALLFGLEEEQVVELHERYLPEEDLQQTIDRLTAPFDCALYDDLCAQIGRDEAIALTAELVDLGLEGASPEQVDAFIDQRLDEGMDAMTDASVTEASDDMVFRSSTGWWSRTSGNVRMLTRNGITTPVIGSRQAWTEAKTQRRNGLGIWNNRDATEICVNTGTNTQVVTICGGGLPCSSNTLESFNPSNSCVASEKSHKVRTYHDRNNGWEGGGFSSSYAITARGCADAEINGTTLTVACAPNHVRVY